MLGKLILKKQSKAGGGMLYFLYNDKVVTVLVCHDIDGGEFVL